MTSFIAFLIALTFGTANIQKSDYQDSINSIEDTQQFGKDDGIGMGDGGQVIEDPNGRG